MVKGLVTTPIRRVRLVSSSAIRSDVRLLNRAPMEQHGRAIIPDTMELLIPICVHSLDYSVK